MKMTMHVEALVVWVLLLSIPAHAKRLPPKPVPPVVAEGVEYTVPHDVLMGLVVAKDIKTRTVLWQRQIYAVRFNPDIEQDVQACYITSLAAGPGKLTIKNERGYIYELVLKTLQVQTKVGGSVVQWGGMK